MPVNVRTVVDTKKAAHQEVFSDGNLVGEIWCEQVHVVVSKLTEPRRMTQKWRWFAKRVGESSTLGRGTRAALLLGPGFKSKGSVLAALTETTPSDTP